MVLSSIKKGLRVKRVKVVTSNPRPQTPNLKKMYELLFWQYQDGIYLNHHLVYEALVEQQEVEGLEILPVQVILNRIQSVFKDWEKVDENSWKNTNGKGAFQLKTTPQSIQIDCYGTEGKTMNLLAEILEEFKCPLYDPQVPVRYDEMNE